MSPQERAKLEQRAKEIERQLAFISRDPQELAKVEGEMALEGTSLPYRMAVNLGAGANSLWTGAKQLFGGVSEEELMRERGLNQAAAESQTGGGLTQVAGEILPTMAIPVGGFANAAKGAWNLGKVALGKELPSSASLIARMGTRGAIADSALAGTVLGGLQPVAEDESRLLNMGLGAAGGAVLPAAVAGARALPRLFTRSGGDDRAASTLIDMMGGQAGAQKAVSDIRNYKPGAFVRDVPMSTAEIVQSIPLAKAERRAAAVNTDDWAALRAAQNEMRYLALRDVTQNADKLDKFQAARAAATDLPRERALNKAAKDMWFHEPVVNAMVALEKGSSGSNPAVQSVVGYVRKELENGITPHRLYTVRKVLANKLSGPLEIADNLSSAAKNAEMETTKMLGAIDEALDKASGGKWQPYLDKYIRMSKPVTSAKAEQKIRDAFEREGAAMVQGMSGPVPSITGFKLGGTIEKFGKNSFGDTLTYGARDALSQLQENVGRSELLQKLLKSTGTSGGGSNTPMDLASAAIAQNRLSRLGQGVHWLVGHSKNVTQGAMSDALRDPDTFVRIVESKLRRQLPLTTKEEIVLSVLRGAGGTALLPTVD